VSRALPGAALLACAALALTWPGATWAGPGATPAARPLTLGFSDGAYTGADAGVWLRRTVAAGADMVRIAIGWPVPNTNTKPAGFDAGNPADPHYDFTQDDQAIKLATALGLKVLATFTGAPLWAEGPGAPADATPGTWKPNPQDLEDYGAALAKRYSGHFPDPSDPGHMLPRVAAFQVWNEPNLSDYLSPQWSGGRPASPDLYRRMLNAFYRGVKSVDPSAVVVTAGSAPFGDQPGGLRMTPVTFWRNLLCLNGAGGRLRSAGCTDPAHFDAWSHHPYAVGSPTWHALDPGDVAMPDLGKLTSLMRAAERDGTALPRGGHPLWVTEVAYNSYPPDPGGVPIQRDARWLEQAFEVLWREGAQAIFWEQVGDMPPIPSFSMTSQSGVYYVNGRPKPALTAYRFPLVGWRESAGTVEIWGRSPVAGRVSIQRQAGSGWRSLRTLNGRRHGVFAISIADRAPIRVRAEVSGQTSLVWTTG
jgi:hypothetical protein